MPLRPEHARHPVCEKVKEKPPYGSPYGGSFSAFCAFSPKDDRERGADRDGGGIGDDEQKRGARRCAVGSVADTPEHVAIAECDGGAHHVGEQDRQHGEGAGQSFHGETSLFVFGAFEQQRRARGDGRDAEQQKNATAVDADHRRSADLRGNGRDKDRQNAIDDQRGRAAEAENEAQKPHRPVLLLRFGGRGIRRTVF